jgi:hypothetical protein
VFEYLLPVDRGLRYDFLLKGYIDHTYKISNFLLRPADKTVFVIKQAGDTLINNFPR